MRVTRSLLVPLTLLGALLALAGVSHAVDGVLEINQTCALETGCFPGDTAGFPVTVSTAGSYRLTSNLELNIGVVDDTPNAIYVGATSNVSIDLNGFAIVCRRDILPSGTAPCANGLGEGITGVDSNLGMIVRNGLIDGFAGDGVSGGSACLIEGVISWNNKQRGITANLGCVVRSNVTYDNGGDGIFASHGTLVEGNTARENGGHGIALGSSSAGYRGNVVSNNTMGTVSGGTNLGGNACDGSTSCP